MVEREQNRPKIAGGGGGQFCTATFYWRFGFSLNVRISSRGFSYSNDNRDDGNAKDIRIKMNLFFVYISRNGDKAVAGVRLFYPQTAKIPLV